MYGSGAEIGLTVNTTIIVPRTIQRVLFMGTNAPCVEAVGAVLHRAVACRVAPPARPTSGQAISGLGWCWGRNRNYLHLGLRGWQSTFPATSVRCTFCRNAWLNFNKNSRFSLTNNKYFYNDE